MTKCGGDGFGLTALDTAAVGDNLPPFRTVFVVRHDLVQLSYLEVISFSNNCIITLKIRTQIL